MRENLTRNCVGRVGSAEDTASSDDAEIRYRHKYVVWRAEEDDVATT